MKIEIEGIWISKSHRFLCIYMKISTALWVSASKDTHLDFIYRGILKCDTAELHCPVKFVTLRYSIPIQTLQSPRPNPSSSHDCTSSNIIPVGWGHVAEPVRLNPNQFLSNGRRKVPNRIYARLIQSACGWGKDDCAIMSSLILFRQTGRQTGRPAQWGWSWRDAHCHQAWLDELSGKYHGCQRVS